MTPSPATGAAPAVRPVRRRVRRVLPLLLATAFPLSACGIPETGVVEAGEPATGVQDPAGATAAARNPSPAVPVDAVPLYFVMDGSLVSVTRPVQGSAEPVSAVLMVFKGPTVQEREDGLATELPRVRTTPTIRIDGGTVSIELPPDLGALNDTAIDQLACTAAAARLHQDPDLAVAQVTVEQPDGRLAGRSSDNCPDLRAARATVTVPPAPR
ncbi:hypothetical protein GCM10010377_40300 [Streptomyces viridiviolaceus]|uniref:GerMN domain-containing protein n=1 Tax=Streptomyces viridiviolaceus TaxID=68282 RepID=A0ABW2E7X5_9ACTN|nr:hypothetical protein [Streptomyces viridiviolaceus]GHB45456.1 hypothetical protein GCM10010377_40300 [Streptomyces viridiviolaceus]